MPTLSEYSGSTMGNLPMGQGLSVTPMQMAAGYTAIANGGILRRPQLIEKVDGEAVQRAAGAPGDRTGGGLAGADDARGGAGAGRDRLGGERSRVHPGGEDRDRAGR